MDTRTGRIILRCVAVGAAFAVGAAAAQTLYKLIDRNGKVTYSESPPKDFDGKVIRMDIDPNANTATLPKAGAGPRPETESEKIIRRPTPATAAADPVQTARERLDAARKALQDAIDNPGEGEIERRGTVSGKSRPVQSEEYQKRLAGLEADVRKAEEELRLAEKNR